MSLKRSSLARDTEMGFPILSISVEDGSHLLIYNISISISIYYKICINTYLFPLVYIQYTDR